MTSAIDITQSVKPPRAVFVNFPLGHQTGPPDQPDLQRRIVTDAMRAFDAITAPATIVEPALRMGRERSIVGRRRLHQGMDAGAAVARRCRPTRSRAPGKIPPRLDRDFASRAFQLARVASSERPSPR